MFFEKHYQELGEVPSYLTDDLIEWCRKINPDQALARTETVFNAYDSRLIVVMDKFVMGYYPAFVKAKALIEWLTNNLHHLPYPVVPYRFELSFVRPHSRVTEHYDMFRFHRLCDRIHVPLVSVGGSEFIGRWHGDSVEERYTIRAGHYTRLNNRAMHQAVNDSDHVRIHAILDFMNVHDIERDGNMKPIEYRVIDKLKPGDPELTFRPK